MDITLTSIFCVLGPAKVCAYINPRGNLGNMVAERCHLEFSFICEFTGSEPAVCRKSVMTVDPDRDYETPSLQLCHEQDQIPDISDGASPALILKNTSKYICDYGEPRSFSELVCCKDC